CGIYAFPTKLTKSSSSPNSNKVVTSSWARSAADKAKLLLHYGSRIVAIKGYDLSSLEVKNIDTRDIYCHARGSYSFRTKGQLTFMRSPNSKLDDDDVLRDVDAQ